MKTRVPAWPWLRVEEFGSFGMLGFERIGLHQASCKGLYKSTIRVRQGFQGSGPCLGFRVWGLGVFGLGLQVFTVARLAVSRS